MELQRQRSLNASTTLEVGYVGSTGIHLQRTTYYNDSPPAAPVNNRNLLRPWPEFGFVQAVEAASHSNYNSLQARVQHHFAQGFTLLSSFSYEKSMDNGSGVRQAAGDSYVPSTRLTWLWSADHPLSISEGNGPLRVSMHCPSAEASISSGKPTGLSTGPRRMADGRDPDV